MSGAAIRDETDGGRRLGIATSLQARRAALPEEVRRIAEGQPRRLAGVVMSSAGIGQLEAENRALREKLAATEAQLRIAEDRATMLNRQVDVLRGIAQPETGRPDRKAIASTVMSVCSVEVHDFHSGRRHRESTWARQMAMALMLRHTSMSLTQVGAFFDRDHATVLHAADAHDLRLGRLARGDSSGQHATFLPAYREQYERVCCALGVQP